MSTITSISDAVQFLSTVVSSDEVLHSAPMSSVPEIIAYALENEIRVTAKVGAYSGVQLFL